MSFSIAVGLASVTLAVTPAAETATTPGPAAITAPGVADLYGRTLGAAAQCAAVGGARIESTAEKAAAHVAALAKSDDERTAAGERFSDAVRQGALAVQNGETMCAQAEADLGNLEHELPP